MDRELVRDRVGWVTDFMKWATHLGATGVVVGLVGAVLVWALVARRCRVLALVLLLMLGITLGLKIPLKAIIDRPRPTLSAAVHSTGPAFPSGHALAAAWFFAMMPALAPRGRLARTMAASAGIVVTLVVGFSRLYLGVHWLTDVVGGLLLGGVLALATYGLLRGHRLDPARCGPGRHSG